MTKLDQMLANYRLKWVNLVLKKGFSRRDVAKFSAHSPNTISLWVKNYQEKGLEGLLNQSRAPLTHPNQYPQDILDKILEVRDRTGFWALNPKLHPFDLLCNELGIKHYLIDPGKPIQNGKVERFHRICEEEFYQRENFKDLNSLRKKFRDFLYYFNNEREGLGLNGLTPLERLRSFPQYSNIKVVC